MDHRKTSGVSSEVRMLLRDRSAQEIQHLLADQQAFTDFLHTLPCVVSLEKSVELMADETEKHAVENLSKETKMEEVRQEVSERLETISSLSSEFDVLRSRHTHLMEKMDPFVIHEGIRNAAVESDQASEDIAERFLNGSADLDTFLNGYLEARKSSHLRRAKQEKLRAMIEEHEDDYR